MIDITRNGEGVKVTMDDVSMTFPKGSLIAHADKGASQSVDLRLKASRKLIVSFPYQECVQAGSDAVATVDILSAYI